MVVNVSARSAMRGSGRLVGSAEPQHFSVFGVGGYAKCVQRRSGVGIGDVGAGVAKRVGLSGQCFEPVGDGRVVCGERGVGDVRMQSSTRAWARCRASRWASWAAPVVAKAA
jgi:hypothetical protein